MSTIEKEFLENSDYLMDLSERVKKSKRISPKLLSEIKCAKSYIDSLSLSSADEYKLSEVSSMFDIIIADSREIKSKNFDNPCSIDIKHIGFNCEAYSIIQFASYIIGVLALCSFLMLLIVLF